MAAIVGVGGKNELKMPVRVAGCPHSGSCIALHRWRAGAVSREGNQKHRLKRLGVKRIIFELIEK